MKLGYFLEKKLERHLISVTFPSDIKIGFASLYGLEKEKEVLQDIVNYFSESSTMTVHPHSSYFISGPLGVGKASLLFALAKESNLPIISLDCSIFRSIDIDDIEKKFELIFSTARKLRNSYKGCLIAFKNADEIELMEDNAIFYSNLMKNIFDLENIFMFMLTINQNMTAPAVITENNLFSTILVVDYPPLAVREKIFEDCIKKRDLKIDTNVSLNRLAKDTIGETPHSIDYIVKEAQLFSLRQKHSTVTQNDFSETIMRISSGEKHLKMTEKERRLTAYHEAGHVIAGYFSNPDYVLKRVEISPRSQGSLGLTATDVDENKYSYFKKDYENMIIEFLGGFCAEELIFKSHTSGVISDLTAATTIAYNMSAAYGMGSVIGPMVMCNGITDSPHTKAKVEDEICERIFNLLIFTGKTIVEHRPHLEALANALIEKEVILGNEIEEIFASVTSDSSITCDPNPNHRNYFEDE